MVALVGLSTLALLSGCDWFGGSSTPADMLKLRPGAEKDVPVSSVLPPPPAGQQYGPPVTPVDATSPQIGSVVAASGGQKAQIEKMTKDELAREEQERQARDKAMEEENKNKERQANNKAGEPPTQPVAPPREAVTGTPVPPPADAAPAASPAGAPADAKPAGS